MNKEDLKVIPLEYNEKYLRSNLYWKMKHLLINPTVSNINSSNLEKINELSSSDENRLHYIGNHSSMMDFIAIMYTFVNENMRNPLIVGGTNMRFPFITQSYFSIPGILDVGKGGMLALNRMGSSPSDRKEYLTNFSNDLYKIWEEYDDLIFLKGRSRSGMPEKDKLPITIRALQDMNQDDGKKHYIVPFTMNYERVTGDWTFSMQDKLKRSKKKYMHALPLLFDAFAWAHHSLFEPKGEIYIDFADPIPFQREVDFNAKNSVILERIYNTILTNVRVSPTSLLCYVMQEINGGPIKRKELVKLIGDKRNNILDNSILAFDSIKDLENITDEEIFERGAMFLNHSRLRPGLRVIPFKGYKFNTHSTKFKYYSNSISNYSTLLSK